MAKSANKLTIDGLGRLIYEIRGERVILDSDLASIYGVETKALNRAVKRNRNRFPKDFGFQLTQDEFELLRRQIGTLKTGRGQHRKYLPWVFTEHGAIMAASAPAKSKLLRVFRKFRSAWQCRGVSVSLESRRRRLIARASRLRCQ
jgi:hypothetical protein